MGKKLSYNQRDMVVQRVVEWFRLWLNGPYKLNSSQKVLIVALAGWMFQMS